MSGIELSSTLTTGPVIIGAAAAVSHYPAVQHARHAHVLHVNVLPAGFGRYVDPRNARSDNLMRSVILDGRKAR